MATTATWHANAEGLGQILAVLRQVNNATAQQAMQQQIGYYSQHGEWGRYLAHILARCNTEPDPVRELAGLLLKHHVNSKYENLTEDELSMLRAESLHVLGDPSALIRRTAAVLVVTLVTRGELASWPTLIPELLRKTTSQVHGEIDGGLYALSLVCEDQQRWLDSPELGHPLATIIPTLMQFFVSPNEMFRIYSLSCIGEFLVEFPPSLAQHQAIVLQGLFSLAGDTSARVKQKVTRALVTLSELHIDVMLPHLQKVIQFMINTTADANEDIALEACEFWQAIAETDVCADIIRPFLPQILPLLLSRMVYSEEDATAGLQEELEANRAGSDKDLKPSQQHYANDDEEDDDDDDEDDDDADDVNDQQNWNIRKCAAAGLDVMSNTFGDELLPVLLPYVQQQLAAPQEQWTQQECAVLAIGAVSEGCINGMTQHLPNLVPYLLNMLEHPRALVRNIACWTISRYARWIVIDAINPPQLPPGTHPHDRLFKPTLLALLKRVDDPVRKVQEAACSALATLEEEAQDEMAPYLVPLVEQLMAAFVKYESRNLLILYDTIGTLAEGVGHQLADPQCTRLLLPPLLERWQRVPDTDTKLLPLLECLTSIASALGPAFQMCAQPIFARALRMIETHLQEQSAYAADPDNQPQPDRDFCVCSLDLIGGLASGLGPALDSLIVQTNCVHLVYQCCCSNAQDIRQSSFALVGDLCRACFEQIRPATSQFVPILASNIIPEFLNVCNNACWALGEMALRGPAEFAPFVPLVLQKLLPIIMRPRERGSFKSVVDNAAVCLGRISLASPDSVAPHFPDFAQQWSGALRELREDDEKADAFRGLCEVLRRNPAGAVKSLFWICQAFASWTWKTPRPEVQLLMTNILHGFKQALGNDWAPFFATFQTGTRDKLHSHYQL